MAPIPNNQPANRLRQIQTLGQSVWQDNITRGQIQTGQLKQLIATDGISGVTSNPSIFEKAIAAGAEYDTAIRELVRQNRDTAAILDQMIIEDIQATADLFRPVWEAAHHHDGFVSIEVAPSLARDTQGTIKEARRLWAAVNRPNILVKIPGTAEGVPAIRQCLAEGININITLLFSIDHYEAVAGAFIEALEQRVAKGLPLDNIASVASFFVSRVDTITDKAINAKLSTETNPQRKAQLESLLGRIAVANAKMAYARFEEIFSPSNARFAHLQSQGAQFQRPLWASTSMKDPKRRDVYYVEELLAPHTVNTMPDQTIDAFRDHGEVRGITAKEDLAGERARLALLKQLGIDLDALTAELENDGIRLFSEAFEKLTSETAHKIEKLQATTVN
ncbi:MAG: transaldolase [Chloroflexi bacterium]|nr:transaldolase [Chloroflexota bacterium]